MLSSFRQSQTKKYSSNEFAFVEEYSRVTYTILYDKICECTQAADVMQKNGWIIVAEQIG